MTDREIVKCFFNRHESALKLVHQKYGVYCRTIALNILHNDEDAEECVNDAYLCAWNSIPPQKPENLRTYIGKLVRNAAVNRYTYLSAQKRGGSQTALALNELEGCLPDESSDFVNMESEIITECINNFLENQPKKKRMIFVRRYWYLSSIKQIAADFSISESKVTSMLYRMRKELKETIEKEGVII